MTSQLQIIFYTSLSGFIAGVISSRLTFMWTEKSKQRDRSIAAEFKQKDIEQIEHNRKADLFKIIYPEKFKASQVLMQAAAIAYNDARDYVASGDPIDSQTESKVKEKIRLVFSLGTTTEWILGREVSRATMRLTNMLHILIEKTYEPRRRLGMTTDEMLDWILETPEFTPGGPLDTAYKDLSSALQRELRLQTIEAVYAEKPPSVAQINDGGHGSRSEKA